MLCAVFLSSFLNLIVVAEVQAHALIDGSSHTATSMRSRVLDPFSADTDESGRGSLGSQDGSDSDETETETESEDANTWSTQPSTASGKAVNTAPSTSINSSSSATNSGKEKKKSAMSGQEKRRAHRGYFRQIPPSFADESDYNQV